jgi:hypothetical protein
VTDDPRSGSTNKEPTSCAFQGQPPDRAHAAPLTFQQAFYEQIHYGSADLKRFDSVFALRISGSLDTGALTKGFETLILRHDSLRTCIRVVHGTLRQFVGSVPGRALNVVARSREAKGTEAIEEQLLRLAHRRFVFEGETLFDATLLQQSEDEAVLFWGMHHFICDHVTRRQLLRELWRLYGRFLSGGECPSDCPSQYWQYGRWQQEAHRKWCETQQSYWQKYLAAASGIRWPTVRKRGPGDEVATVSVAWDSTLSSSLRGLAERRRTWLSILVLAIYVVTVCQWCDQRDVVIATTVTGRDRPEHQSIAGFLAHPLYLRVQLMGDETYAELIDVVVREYNRSLFRKDFGGLVMKNQDLLAGTLFQWFPLLGESLFPVTEGTTDSGLSVTAFPLPFMKYLPEAYNLMLVLADSPQGILSIVTHRQSAFASEMIQNFLVKLQSAGNRLIACPDNRIWPSCS